MNVVVIAEQLRRAVPGGIGTYVRGLAHGLDSLIADDTAADRLHVSFHASRAPAPDPLADLGFPVRTSMLPGALLTRAWDRGLPVPLPASADVLHATSFAAPWRTRVPLSMMVHDLAWRKVPDAYPRRGRQWHDRALGHALAGARLFVTPSTATAGDLVAAGAPAGRVEVVPEGCDHLPPPDRRGATRVLDRHGVSGPYLLTVSTLEPRKNLPRLLAAYAKARPRLPDRWPLVVVGPPGWGPEVAPVEGAMVTGRVTDAVLAGLYAGARCVAYVPLMEGFGLPALEAMAACVPVVASPMPSTGDASLEVDPTDEDAIADGLVTAAADERARAELVTAGLQRARQLTWAVAARRHVELWRSIR
jgi:glycosyltransferase involved in cell wall biosynthesis